MSKTPSNYWFKRRRYGWGWVPVTWQGFATLIGFLVVILIAAYQMPPKPAQPSTSQLVLFVSIFAGAVIVLVLIGLAKGPRPQWRWGKSQSDNPDEDF